MGDSEDFEAQTVAKSLGVPYANFENRILKMEPGLQEFVSGEFAREHLVLPLFIDGGVLCVAMKNPSDEFVLARLKELSKLQIQPFVATQTDLLKAISTEYGS